MKVISRVAAAAALLLCATCFTRADDVADVRASGKAFAQALSTGDSATAKKYAITDENSSKLLDALGEVSKAHKNLTDAAVAKFGEEGKSLMPQGPGGNPAEAIGKKIDDAKIDVSGDTATIATANDEQPVKFKKDNGQWKIDFTSLPHQEQMQKAVPFMGKIATAMNETATDIKDGKYKTVNEARMGMRQKMMEAMGMPRGGPGGPPNGGGEEK